MAKNPRPPADAGTAPAAEKVKRPRVKGEVLIQHTDPADPTAAASPVYLDLDAGPFADVAAAIAHVRREKIVGRLRIVSVRRTLTVEEVQTTTLKLT